MPTEIPPEPGTQVVTGPFHDRRIAALALMGGLLTFCTIVGSIARWGSPQMLPPGKPIPPFVMSDSDGRLVESGEIRNGNTILLFIKPGCVHCTAMIGRMHELHHTIPDRVKVIFISLSTPSELRSRGADVEKDSLVYFIDPVIARRVLHVKSVPVMLLVDGGGVLLEEIVGERPAFSLRHSIARAFTNGHEG
jgi:hypothetical protein